MTDTPTPAAHVTPRQQALLALLVRGAAPGTLAARLHSTARTVAAELTALQQRSGTTTQTGLMRWACREGLVTVHGEPWWLRKWLESPEPSVSEGS
jgi:DNA-binding NarL/FixJ family response regulator